jgi:ABC-type branched-subunit amino acid transport system ATPase component
MKHNNAAVLLKVSDVKVGYGGIQAVKGVSLEVSWSRSLARMAQAKPPP